MTNDNKRDNPDDNPTTGKDGATTSIERDQKNQNSRNHGDGQQGAGGLGGVSERTTPNPAGSQPDLGGAVAPKRGSSAGTGFTEESDPLSRKSVPDLADPKAPHTNKPD